MENFSKPEEESSMDDPKLHSLESSSRASGCITRGAPATASKDSGGAAEAPAAVAANAAKLVAEATASAANAAGREAETDREMSADSDARPKALPNPGKR